MATPRKKSPPIEKPPTLVAILLTQLEQERTRYHQLVEVIAAMKRDGFQSGPVGGGPAPDHGMTEAIGEALASIPGEERSRVRAWAMEQLYLGVPSDQIAEQIRKGS